MNASKDTNALASPIADRRKWRALEPVSLSDGSAAARWLCDPDGDGIGVARSAVPNLDKIEGQLVALEALHSRGRRLREIVVANGVGGNRRFHERPDLLAVEAAVLSEPRWVQFVAFTDESRVSRSGDGLMLFAEFLHEHHVELVLLDRGDQATDVVGSAEFRLLASLAAAQREALLGRMKAGKLRQRQHLK